MLEHYMKLKNINDAEMALKVGVVKSAIGKWRRGEAIPRVEHVAYIANMTDGAVTANDFYLVNVSKQSNFSNIVNGTAA